MTENFDRQAADSSFETRRESILKQLRLLFMLQCAALFLSTLSDVSSFSSAATWASRIVTACLVICLFQLAPANTRYRKAAIFRAATLGCILINLILSAVVLKTEMKAAAAAVVSTVGQLVTLAASVCSFVSSYQEYSAHGELAAADMKLPSRWHTLFNWQIIVAVLITLVTGTTAVITVLLSVEAAVIVSLIMWIFTIVKAALNVAYLVLLNRTIRLLAG